jgi:DNA-binding transcriptional ArsR family regulator
MRMHADRDDFQMPDDVAVAQAADALRLLADPTRIKILWALAQGESNVGCLAELSGASQPATSQHLAKLRLAGLVTATREGGFVYYELAGADTGQLLAKALGLPRPRRLTRHAGQLSEPARRSPHVSRI